VLNQIAKALRVSAEVLYVRAGMLEPSEASDVRDAVIADTAISERQKQALLEIYASFVDQNAAGAAPAATLAAGTAAALAAAPDAGTAAALAAAPDEAAGPEHTEARH
jgi:hypothetical protein